MFLVLLVGVGPWFPSGRCKHIHYSDVISLLVDASFTVTQVSAMSGRARSHGAGEVTVGGRIVTRPRGFGSHSGNPYVCGLLASDDSAQRYKEKILRAAKENVK